MKNLPLNIVLCTVLALMASCGNGGYEEINTDLVNELRAPAAPLITVDPYFSVWSFTSDLNTSQTVHWTGKQHPLLGAVRVDGVTYRVMGWEEIKTEIIMPTIAVEQWEAPYVTSPPAGNWTAVDYDDSGWKVVPGAIGTPEMPSVGTYWRDGDVWVRRTFELDGDVTGETLILEYSHDDVFELYINGIEVANTGNTWRNNVRVELNDVVKKSLRKGTNVIAAHCHNTTGGAYVDFGLFRAVQNGSTFDNLARQKSVNVLPTRTMYKFECGPVEVDLIFTAPLLMDDLDLMSSPVNYLTYQVRSADGREHDVQFYFETTPQIAVHAESQPVVTTYGNASGIEYLKTGTVEQNILGRSGDDIRIDWGYYYVAVPEGRGRLAIRDYYRPKKEFIETGSVDPGEPIAETPNMFREKNVMVFCDDLGTVTEKFSGGFIMLGYDDIRSIQYFGEDLRPYWNRTGRVAITDVLSTFAADYNKIMKRCTGFDKALMDRTLRDGGKEYSEICATVYRQAVSAHKLVEDSDGNLLFFSKENFSNGSIGTVDITYPSSPLFLVYNPELLKGMMNPIFHYSESGKWTKPFAAHDVGTYPLANGQTYGGDMPVEESGNMLILAAAIAHAEGNASYAARHWDVLSTWADYLVAEGLDPENQLCTDDFAGHFAHNTNLSVKAIMGIAGYGKLARMLGMEEVAERYTAQAREMAAKWKAMADDGDHYRLTFDQPGTWSQKYNIVWDKILGLEIFDPSIAQVETQYYLTKQNRYGLPLDSRKTYTKTDWIMWTACLTDDPNNWRQLVVPVYNYIDETSSRIPISDWHDTVTGESVGFRARSVVGGYYMKSLEREFAGK